MRYAALIRLIARSLTHSRIGGKEFFSMKLTQSNSHSFNPLCNVFLRFHGHVRVSPRFYGYKESQDTALWFRTAKSRDISTGPLALSLAPLTPLHTTRFARALRCAPLRSFVFRSLTHSRARGKMYDSMSHNDLVLPHSAPVTETRNVSLSIRGRALNRLFLAFSPNPSRGPSFLPLGTLRA